MSDLIISKEWAMPNGNTFSIPPIGRLINKYLSGVSVDPFANSNRLATITNDLDPQYESDFNMDALDFLKTIDADSIDTVLFDPPIFSEASKRMLQVNGYGCKHADHSIIILEQIKERGRQDNKGGWSINYMWLEQWRDWHKIWV